MADEVISGPADGDGSRLPFCLLDKGCRLDDAVDYSEGEAE